MVTMFTPKNPRIFNCTYCDYNSSNKKDYKRHLMTNKHKMITNDNKIDNINPKKPLRVYTCKCGNKYKYASGLSRHINQCKYIDNSLDVTTNPTSPNIVDIDKELFVKMLLENQDIMKGVIMKNQDVMEKMMEVLPHMGGNTISNMTNSHNITNNQFNIQMFLNDHCKNAMNLTDFIHSLPITSETYDDTIENGLTKTITNMMVNGLNELDILDRPIHCTDASRKTLYVKDADNWEKDNELLHIIKGIRELSLKQRTMINKWKEANDGWKTDDKLQSRMTSLVFNSMTQIENDEKETSKIIKSISKNVYLDNETKKGYTIQ